MPTNRLTRKAYVITVLLMENQSQKSSEVEVKPLKALTLLWSTQFCSYPEDIWQSDQAELFRVHSCP